MSKKFLILFLVFFMGLYIGCSKEKPIYEATPESIHLGSKIYASNEVNCKNCHGNDYKSNTPDAKEIKDSGINVPDFTAELAPEKTPLDYFKAISVGTDKTGTQEYNYHAYYNLTDTAKWALANFLYSLGKEPQSEEGKKQRKIALNKAQLEVYSIYSKNRKWYMGKNTPSQQREKSEKLEDLIQKTNYNVEKDVSISVVNNEQLKKQEKFQEENPEGYRLYKENCQSCHGKIGEGVQGQMDINVLDESRNSPIKNIARRKSAFIGIEALNASKISKENILKAHKELYFSEDQWNVLINYLKNIMEK